MWLAFGRAVAVAAVVVTLVALQTGCASRQAQKASPQRLVLATTTSTQDSGLLDVLVPAFETAHPEYAVEVIAVGRGEALRLGEQKDADVLLVHAPKDEAAFVAAGHGIERRDVCYNRFVLVGPASDPAGAAHAADAADALKRIAARQALFASRGDDSGTHKKELALWNAAGVKPGGAWYLVTGQGMGETLKIASEKQAYTLSDEATFLTMRGSLDLAQLFDADQSLRNQYGVVPVTGAKNERGAREFADWICGPDAQRLIARFGVDEFGRSLFVPNAQGGGS
jgi:tungstate transport system substrate-binding protein